MDRLEFSAMIAQTLEDLKSAENRFNFSKGTEADIAMIDIKAAEEKLNLLYKGAKELEGSVTYGR